MTHRLRTRVPSLLLLTCGLLCTGPQFVIAAAPPPSEGATCTAPGRRAANDPTLACVNRIGAKGSAWHRILPLGSGPAAAPTGGATPAPTSTSPAAGASSASAAPGTGSKALGVTVDFGDVRAELRTLRLVGRDLFLDASMTNRGLRDEAFGRTMSDSPVVARTASGDLPMSDSTFSAVAVGSTVERTFKATVPSSFTLNSVTAIRFGNAGGNPVVATIGGAVTGSFPTRRGFITGSANWTATSGSRSGEATIEVVDSYLRQSSRASKQGIYDLQLKIRVTGRTASPGGVNLSTESLLLDGVSSLCCTDLQNLIVLFNAGSVSEGWVNWEIRTPPAAGPTMTLSGARGATGSTQLTVAAG